MVVGLNHITIAVSNIEKSFNFYVNLLGFKPHIRWDKGAYLTLEGVWLCLSLDEVEPSNDYTHLAFSIRKEELEKIKRDFKKNEIKEWKTNTSEGESIYFLDPDGHKLELHVGTLETRLEHISNNPYKGLVYFN